MTAVRTHWPLLAAVVLALAFKLVLLSAAVFPFNSDEAVVALMARHILQGARPVFFYGQAYLGSLDAWLVAVMMRLVGERVLAVRLLQMALYVGTVATTYGLAWRMYASRWAAAAAALLLAVPVVLVTLYTTVSLGGYGEMLLIGNVLLLWVMRLREGAPAWAWAAFGLLSGVAFWGFGFVGVYLLPCGLALGWPLLRERRWRVLLGRGGLMALGFVVGATPWWWFAVNNGAAAIAELGGSHVAVTGGGQLAETGLRAGLLLLFGPTVVLGLRPPWSAELLALPLAPIALVLGLGALVFGVRRQWQTRGTTATPGDVARSLVLGVMATNALAFVLTSFGNDPSGRYFLPIAVLLPVLGAGLLLWLHGQRPLWANGALVLWLMFNGVATAQVVLAYPDDGPGFTTQFDAVAQIDRRYDAVLVDFLLSEGETRGYGNYWVTFPLAFNSDEALQYSAQLPYHHDFAYTPRDDRYLPYRDAVAAADRVAYVTSNHTALDARLRDGFSGLGVTFAETHIGDYTVFHNLSRAVRPAELGLGERYAGDTRD